jgi:hypothetical protein
LLRRLATDPLPLFSAAPQRRPIPIMGSEWTPGFAPWNLYELIGKMGNRE